MKTFQIENIASGIVLGQYEAECVEHALYAMAQDAGYEGKGAFAQVEIFLYDKNILVKEV